MKYISIIGSTGSIGTQTLDIVRSNKDLKVTALAAGTNIDLLEKQAREFQPVIVAVYNEQKAEELKLRLADTNIKVCAGMDGLLEAATQEQCSVVVTAIVGMIGIRPTIAAMKAGKDIALANKETLVTAGHIIMPMAEELGKTGGFPLAPFPACGEGTERTYAYEVFSETGRGGGGADFSHRGRGGDWAGQEAGHRRPGVHRHCGVLYVCI